MLAKYKSLFSSRSSNRLDQVDDPENSQPQSRPEERAADTLMTSQYKISDTKTIVEQWKNYINIFGWFLICYGSLKMILVFLGLVFVHSQEYEITKPDGSFDTYYTSITFEVISRLLSNLSNTSIIILGIGCRKASSKTTRAETWEVCKTAFYIAIFQAVIILIKFYLSGIVVLAVIKRWQERHDIPAGNYVFKNKNTGAEYRYYKPVAKSDIAKQKEFDTKDQVKDVFMMSIISTLFCSCCYLAIYCSLTILALFKFHSSTKELEIMTEFSNIREISLNRQESSSLSQEQSNP